MWPNTQFTADLVIFTGKILTGLENFIFCAVRSFSIEISSWKNTMEINSSKQPKHSVRDSAIEAIDVHTLYRICLRLLFVLYLKTVISVKYEF